MLKSKAYLQKHHIRDVSNRRPSRDQPLKHDVFPFRQILPTGQVELEKNINNETFCRYFSDTITAVIVLVDAVEKTSRSLAGAKIVGAAA